MATQQGILPSERQRVSELFQIKSLRQTMPFFARFDNLPRQRQGPDNNTKHRQGRDRNNIRPLDTSDNSSQSSDSDYCYVVHMDNNNRDPITKIKINEQQVKFTVDTGSTINIIDQHTFTSQRKAR